MARRKNRRRVLALVAVMAVAVLCAAPNRRKELDPVGKPAQKPSLRRGTEAGPAPRGQKGPKAARGRPRGGQLDLLSLLAGPRGAGVFLPGGWGVFDPGAWGIFDPGGWGMHGEQNTASSGRPTGKRQIALARAAQGRMRGRRPIDSEQQVVQTRPGGPKGAKDEGVFGPGDWGVMPLLARGQADLSVATSGAGVSVRVTGKDRNAVQMIQRLIRAGKRGVWLDIDRTARGGQKAGRPRPGARPAGPGKRRGISGSGQSEEVPTEEVGQGVSPDVIDPVSVEPLQNGVAIHLQAPPQRAGQLQADARLQVEAVGRLSRAVGAAMRLRQLLRSGDVRSRWEPRREGAALVFTGPAELQGAAEELGKFADYLDGKGDDIRAARRRTAACFGPAGQRRPPRPDRTGKPVRRPRQGTAKPR